MSFLSRKPYLPGSDFTSATVKWNDKSLVNRRILGTVCLASGVAAFDFTIYVFMSDTSGKVFFPVDVKDYLGRLQMIALLATGFIARPIGGFWFGRYGDKQGRLPVLRLAMSLFLITTLSAILLPTYALAGLFATSMLIGIRLLQGAAFAILVVLGFVFVAESLPRQRLAFNVSLVLASFILGVVSSSGLSQIIIHILPEQQLLSYGWRLTFLVSAILSGIAFLFISRLNETSLFLKYGNHNNNLSQDDFKNKSASSLLAVKTSLHLQTPANSANQITPIRTSPKSNLIGAIVINGFLEFISSSLILMVCLLLPKLLLIRFVIDDNVLGTANMCGMVGLILGVIFYGWLADKISAARTLMIGSAILTLLALTLYSYLSHGNSGHIIIVYTLIGLGAGVLAMCPLMIIQLYATPRRLTISSMVFNIVTVLTGALVPFGLYYATNIIAFTPALYITFICGCAFAIGTLINSSPDMNKLEPMPKN